MPSVSWILQYDPATSFDAYIHRIGRTARIGKKGDALVFLDKDESSFAHTLASMGMTIDEFFFEKLLNSDSYLKNTPSSDRILTKADIPYAIQTRVQDYIEVTEDIRKFAISGYQSYVKGYATFTKELKPFFPSKSLHLGHVAKSFGLVMTPSQLGKKINQDNLKVAAKKRKRQHQQNFIDKGHSIASSFSEFSSGFE